jgi:hypothetical protein
VHETNWQAPEVIGAAHMCCDPTPGSFMGTWAATFPAGPPKACRVRGPASCSTVGHVLVVTDPPVPVTTVLVVAVPPEPPEAVVAPPVAVAAPPEPVLVTPVLVVDGGGVTSMVDEHAAAARRALEARRKRGRLMGPSMVERARGLRKRCPASGIDPFPALTPPSAADTSRPASPHLAPEIPRVSPGPRRA